MDDDDEHLTVYGTPLEPLDENDIPAKKPFAIEDQIVTDENGKRRFHGAFTGGFSAGFWNTVGSLEGWKPTDFKSSRNEKAPQRVQQKPEDFMDDEDLGQFGIAPQLIQAQRDFQIENKSNTSNRKRKFLQPTLGAGGAIPGVPVLAQLLRPVEDKIAVRILKSMGWRPGQGIGPRLTGKEKKKTRERNKREEYILQHYGVLKENDGNEKAMNSNDDDDDEDEDDDDNDNELTFAPDDYDPLICVAKTNRFGLGYSGLNRADTTTSVASTSKLEHINLFGPLEMVDKNNKKLSITGQAFGVGALEEEDEDIYARDDMTKYDFSLERKSKPKKRTEQHVQDKHIIVGFIATKTETQYQPVFAVDLPRDFEPRNWAMRRSRFAPLPMEKLREIQTTEAYKKRGLGRHELNPEQRGAMLENKPTTTKQLTTEKQSIEELQQAQRTRNERTKALLDKISAKGDNFTRGGIINTKGEEIVTAKGTEMEKVKEDVEKEKKELMEKASNKTKNLATDDPSKFKPFLGNEAKQQRYEKFLERNLRGENEIAEFLVTIQPIELSDWDREMEKQEFIQARKIYKPLVGIMSDRFVSESTIAAEKLSTETKDTQTSKDPKKIVMKRSKEMWKPDSLLCKRYNIAEPFGGSMLETDTKSSRKAKMSIFEYLETSVNKKSDFQTPRIIPKHLEKPRALIDSRDHQSKEFITEFNDEKSSSAATTAESVTIPDVMRATEHPINPIIEPTTKHLKLPPKTELEKRVEESRDKPASEKIELFRAIFEDSDEDDDDDVEAQSKAKETELEIQKLNLPKLVKPATAAAINVLRNNSPPRGIFASLFNTKTSTTTTTTTEEEVEKDEAVKTTEMETNQIKTPLVNEANKDTAPQRITFKSRVEREKQQTQETNDQYGPKLPMPSSATASSTIDTKLLKLFEKHKSTKVKEEVWVERTTGGNEADSDSSSSRSSSSSNSSTGSSSKKHKKKSKKSKKSSTKKKAKKTKKKGKTKKKLEDIVKSNKSSKKKKKKSK